MPAEFIIKLQQMFKDLKLNRDMNEEFRSVCPSSRNNNTMMGKYPTYVWNWFICLFHLDSFSFKILSAAAWPHPGDKIDVSLPAQIEDVLPEIEEFYKKKHSGRKLTWHHTVSNGQVILFFISRTQFYGEILSSTVNIRIKKWQIRSRRVDTSSFRTLRLESSTE